MWGKLVGRSGPDTGANLSLELAHREIRALSSSSDVE